MSETLVWWLMMQVVGLATLPLCLALFGRLPDRGYTLSKAFALIIVGYLLWILNVAHILPNTSAGIWIILLVLFGVSALVFRQRRDDLLGFVRTHWWLIAATEIVLFLSFVTAVYLRSYVGDLGGTEKPMDFMLLNAVTRADHFPPLDPWMAGEKVAYYYFGYLIVSIMTRLAGLPTSVGFNLGVAMTASLAVVGAFGLAYNMIAPRAQRELEAEPGAAAAGFSKRILWRPIIFGVVAAFLMVVIGNLEGILEAFAATGMGSAGFWSWINIEGLQSYQSAHWYPDNFWGWWRATRILDSSTGIHEFPFFSFLLGDLHPHVMSIPFVLLALGVAQLLLRFEGPLDLVVWLERPFWLVAFAIMIGGLAFINTWDLPTMVFMVALAALVRNRLHADRWSWGLAADTAGFLLPLFFCAMLAFTPFFFGGFDSQASGFKAVSNGGTRLFQALMLWGVFAVIVLPYAAWRLHRNGFWAALRSEPGSEFLSGITTIVIAVSTTTIGLSRTSGTVQDSALTLGGLIFVLGAALPFLWPTIERYLTKRPPAVKPAPTVWFQLWWACAPMTVVLLLWLIWEALAGTTTSASLGVNNLLGWLPLPMRPIDLEAGISLGDRIGARDWNWLTVPLMGGAVALLGLALYREVEDAKRTGEERFGHIFALGLSGTAALLILGSEFFFILDTFNGRMNTIFKLYYQAWLMLSVAGGFVLYEITQGFRMPTRSAPRTEAAPVSLGRLTIGDIVVSAATLSGAIVGLLLGQDGLTRIVGFVVGAGASFVISGAAVLSWQMALREGEQTLAVSRLTWRGVWAGAAATVLFAAFLYPVLATYNRTNGFNNPHMLDGLDARPPEERAIIDFLRGQSGHPVVLEAPGGDYSDYGTISAATGLPTILQWRFHEVQWRGGSKALEEELNQREQAIEAIYTGSSDAARSMLTLYDVRFVVVGPKEREKYASITIDQMTDLVEQVNLQGEIAVYRVRPDNLSGVSAGDSP